MYAVNTRFRFGVPVSDDFRAELEQVVATRLAAAPGFRDFYAVAATDRELVTFHVWDDQGAAQAGLHMVGEWIRERIEPNLARALERSAGEVVIRVSRT
jgi:hypothetical protein